MEQTPTVEQAVAQSPAASWPFDGISGVAWLKLGLDDPSTLPAFPYRLTGLRPVRIAEGEVELEWRVDEAVLNRAGVAHGGSIATVLDEVTGVTATSTTDPALPFLTMSLNVDFLRPLLPGELYTVTGRALQRGRTRTLVHGAVTDAAGRLHAQANASLTPNRRLLAAHPH